MPLPVEAMLLRRRSGHPLAFLSAGGRWEHGDLFAEWEVELDGAQAGKKLTAHGEDAAGNVEKTPHEVALGVR